jgi:flagellar biosynthesis protein FlhG
MKDLAQNNVNRIVPLPRVFRGHGMRIISITGGKGGVGKSCVAVNLALGLQKLGGRILLLDGDLGLANADQLLGVHAPSTLLDVVQGRTALAEAIVETPYGVSLLPACSGRQEMAELDENTRATLLENVRALDGEYDFVVVDTAAGIGETALGLAGAGSQILAVATPDPTSARDVFAVMKILSKDYGVRNLSLVPNMVSSPAEGMALYQKISRVTGRFLPLTLSLGGIVMRDPNLAKSVRNRAPMMATYPGASASKQISDIAVRLVTRDREMHFFDDNDLEDLT